LELLFAPDRTRDEFGKISHSRHRVGTGVAAAFGEGWRLHTSGDAFADEAAGRA
jgi:hypothetical protein